MLAKESFKGKTVLVTGGGTGLGRSMAEYLGSLGANLILFSRKEEVLEQTAKEIKEEFGCKVLVTSGDIREYGDVERSFKKGIETFGSVDGLINNAAGNFISRTEDLSHRAFKVVTDIVLNGTFNMSHCFGKYLLDNELKGSILNITTTYSWTGSGYVVPSACAKAGVTAMTRSLAAEWANRGIRVNAIAPGPFPTKGAWQRLFPESVAKSIDPLQRIPMGRFGEHKELAYLAAYLLSDYSGFINGEIVTIDGGEWIYNAGQFNYLDRVPSEMWDVMKKRTKDSSGK